MLSARPVLRTAVRTATIAARSSLRVVCIEHHSTWKEATEIMRRIQRNVISNNHI